MSDTEHSPTPWSVDRTGYDGPTIIDARGEPLFYVADAEPDGSSDRLADRVVRVVNAHDALVAALEAVMDGASDFGGDYSAGMPDSLRSAMEQGETTLRLAKGEAS